MYDGDWYINEIYHYGIPRRSGRYPYGSGERPFQDREQAKRLKNISVGKERLTNRIARANALAAMIGYGGYKYYQKTKY